MFGKYKCLFYWKNHYGQNKSCKVFILSEFVDNTENSTGYYWSKIIGGLSERFSNVHVISTKNSYDNIKAPSNLVTYIQINSIEFNKKKLVSRLFGQACQTFFFSKAIIKNIQRGDVIFSGTNPTLLLIAISILKSFKGFKWMILVHDVFPENLVAGKLIKNKALFYRLLKRLFDRVYSSADTLIAIGRDMYDLLSLKTKMQCRIECIPNWVDLADIITLKRNSKKLFFALDKNKIIFQFFGNLGRLQGIKNLLKAILLVKNRNASFVFI
jgi:glycosyltransferase involved in cell wall biosynthesis